MVKSWEDAQKIKAVASDVKRAVVIGAAILVLKLRAVFGDTQKGDFS